MLRSFVKLQLYVEIGKKWIAEDGYKKRNDWIAIDVTSYKPRLLKIAKLFSIA